MKMDIQIKTINDAKERDDSFESTATISFKMNNASAWACPAEITVCGKTKEEAEKLLQEELNEAFSPSAQARREAFDRAIEIVMKKRSPIHGNDILTVKRSMKLLRW